MKPRPTAVERAERRVVRAAIAWADGIVEVYGLSNKRLWEEVKILLVYRRAARKKAGRK